MISNKRANYKRPQKAEIARKTIVSAAFVYPFKKPCAIFTRPSEIISRRYQTGVIHSREFDKNLFPVILISQ